jgi:hypothetical protein
MPNGISPFNYRKLTPEQERRGDRAALTMSVLVLFLTGLLALIGHFSR